MNKKLQFIGFGKLILTNKKLLILFISLLLSTVIKSQDSLRVNVVTLNAHIKYRFYSGKVLYQYNYSSNIGAVAFYMKPPEEYVTKNGFYLQVQTKRRFS